MTGRIRNNPTVTTPQPLRDTPPAATTTPSTPAGEPAPRGWSPRGAATARVAGTVSNALKSAGPSSMEMLPGRYPDAVSFPTVLKAVGNSPQGQAALKEVLDGIKAKTGVEVPAELRAAVLANPEALTKALEVTPGQLSGGILGMNAAYQAGKLKAPAESPKLLPQKFDLKDLASLDVARPKSELKELAPGLFQGDLPSAATDAQVKQNRVLAEVFHRLAGNASAADGQKFEVTYNGKSFSTLSDFTAALKKDGYEVNVRFDERIANFSNLKTAVPGTNPPKFVDVPAPLMIKTGIKDAGGKEALVPAVHSEMIISLKPGPNTKGPKFEAELKYYQGVSATGFFPANVHADPSWCGRKTVGEASGDKALKAIKLAGAFTDLVNTTAKDKHLYAAGYGVTGVCNDSVAVVQQALTGKASQYPLLMKDSVLMGEIDKRLSDANRADDATFKSLRNAIKDLPSDTRMTPSTKARALASLPWTEGKEPFQSSVDARRILSE
ncbi:MAG: hypothetical protein AMXMBFR34_17400 [Myxococcaceae bacterium]